MHLITQDAYGPGAREPKEHDPPLLYNLEHDPSERLDVADKHSDVIEMLQAAVAQHRAELAHADSQLEK